VACSLPGEFCRFCWSWLLTYVERFRRLACNACT